MGGCGARLWRHIDRMSYPAHASLKNSAGIRYRRGVPSAALTRIRRRAACTAKCTATSVGDVRCRAPTQTRCREKVHCGRNNSPIPKVLLLKTRVMYAILSWNDARLHHDDHRIANRSRSMRRRTTNRYRPTFRDRLLIALIQSARRASALDFPTLSFPVSRPSTRTITSCACPWRAGGMQPVSFHPGGRR